MTNTRQPVASTEVEINLESEAGRNALNKLLATYVDYAVTVEKAPSQSARGFAVKRKDGTQKPAPDTEFILFFENRNTAGDFCAKMFSDFNVSAMNDKNRKKSSQLIGNRRGVYMRVSECNSIYAELLQRQPKQPKPAETAVPVASDLGKRLSVTQLGMFTSKPEPKDIEKEGQFQQFKAAYEQAYQASAYKKHKKMMAQLESGGICEIDQIIDYARNKPYSLTASVLSSFDFVDELTQFIIAYGQYKKKPWSTKDSGLEDLLKKPELSIDKVREYAQASPNAKANVILTKMEEKQGNRRTLSK